ncbi:hypothetical protein ACSNOA_31385 [Micromonospora sp. URMC 103]
MLVAARDGDRLSDGFGDRLADGDADRLADGDGEWLADGEAEKPAESVGPGAPVTEVSIGTDPASTAPFSSGAAQDVSPSPPSSATAMTPITARLNGVGIPTPPWFLISSPAVGSTVSPTPVSQAPAIPHLLAPSAGRPSRDRRVLVILGVRTRDQKAERPVRSSRIDRAFSHLTSGGGGI